MQALELNAHPERLDLPEVHCRKARERGVKIVISTDSHQDSQLDSIRFGVTAAAEMPGVRVPCPRGPCAAWMRRQRTYSVNGGAGVDAVRCHIVDRGSSPQGSGSTQISLDKSLAVVGESSTAGGMINAKRSHLESDS